jgi:hypothetical protein
MLECFVGILVQYLLMNCCTPIAVQLNVYVQCWYVSLEFWQSIC